MHLSAAVSEHVSPDMRFRIVAKAERQTVGHGDPAIVFSVQIIGSVYAHRHVSLHAPAYSTDPPQALTLPVPSAASTPLCPPVPGTRRKQASVCCAPWQC